MPDQTDLITGSPQITPRLPAIERKPSRMRRIFPSFQHIATPPGHRKGNITIGPQTPTRSVVLAGRDHASSLDPLPSVGTASKDLTDLALAWIDVGRPKLFLAHESSHGSRVETPRSPRVAPLRSTTVDAMPAFLRLHPACINHTTGRLISP
jgi:hypothetical protein